MTSSSTATGRRLLWAVAALVALAIAAWATLVVLFPPPKLRALVQQQLSAALAREVRFGDATLGLWPPIRLTVWQPELAEPGGFGNGAAFRARSLHLDLDVLALLGRRIVVRRLVADRPSLHLALSADGTTNLDGIVKAPPAGRPAAKPMDLELRQLRVEEGRALVDDHKAARRITFGLDSRLALQTEASGSRVATTGETRISGLAFGPLAAARLSDLNASLAKLTWRIEHRGAYDGSTKRLALERLALDLGKTEIALSGVVDEPGPRARVDLHARGMQVELAQVLDYLAVADAKALHGVQGSGRLDFDLGVRGALGRGGPPAVTGSLTVAEGAFRYPGAPAGVSHLSFAARFGPDSLAIVNLAAVATGASDPRAEIAPLRGSLVITRFADPQVSFDVRGPVNLAVVSPLLAARDTRLRGRADVEVSGRGRARDPGALALEGRARLADVSLESPRLPKKVEKIQGEIEFSPGRAAVRGLGLQAGQSSLALDATVTRPLALMAKPGKVAPAGVDFTLRSPYLDLAELLPAAPGQPILPNASGGGTVVIARLKNRRLDVENVTARVEMTPATLDVPAYSLRGYGGTVTGKAAFDLGDPARPGFSVKAQVDSVEADALLSAWTPARGWIHGALNSTLDLSGDGATPEDLKRTLTAVGLALVSNGTLGPGPALEAVANATGIPAFKEVRFRDLRLPLRVERGRVITDPVAIEGHYGRWQLAGGIAFDGRLDYAVSVTLPPEVAAALNARSALAAGALSDAKGNLLLDLRVSGPAKAPKVTWDTRAMRDRLAGKLSQALEEQRAKMGEEARASLAEQRQAAEDSARAAIARARRAAEDSLERRARDLLKRFFGGKPDTTP